jgi:hypothetical protein
MRQAQFGQHPFCPICQIDKDLAPVFRILLSFGQAIRDEPVDQLNGGVVPNTKTFGQDADGDVPCRGSFDCEQSLMLLRTQPRLRCGMLTELQKSTQVITEFRQALIIRLIERSARSHLQPLKLQGLNAFGLSVKQ